MHVAIRANILPPALLCRGLILSHACPFVRAISLQGLRSVLKELCWHEGWACDRLPTAQQLREADRTDLVRVSTGDLMQLV